MSTATDNGINLDAMFADDLWAFWRNCNRARPIAFARQLFPERPRGYVAATRQLGNYAANKATAMTCRENGKICEASTYETICDNIYNQLPEFAKW